MDLLTAQRYAGGKNCCGHWSPSYNICTVPDHLPHTDHQHWTEFGSSDADPVDGSRCLERWPNPNATVNVAKATFTAESPKAPEPKKSPYDTEIGDWDLLPDEEFKDYGKLPHWYDLP